MYLTATCALIIIKMLVSYKKHLVKSLWRKLTSKRHPGDQVHFIDILWTFFFE